eukprot:Pgem_evm2s14760
MLAFLLYAQWNEAYFNKTQALSISNNNPRVGYNNTTDRDFNINNSYNVNDGNSKCQGSLNVNVNVNATDNLSRGRYSNCKSESKNGDAIQITRESDSNLILDLKD